MGLLFHSQYSFALEESPQTFTFEGRAYQTDGTSPLLDTVDFKFEILNNAGDCVLYQEAQLAQDLITSKGVFAINVGSPVGNAKRTAGGSADSLLTMAQIFQNRSAVSVPVGICAAGTFTPASGEQRKLRVTITPASTGVPEVIALNFPVNSVPQALVAETLQGIGPDGFVKIDTPSNLTQANILTLVNGGDIAAARHHHNTENDLRYAKLSSASNQNFGTGSVYTAGRIGIGMSSAPTTDLMFGGNSTRQILVDSPNIS
ncbi:MAG: hypothetical protein SGI74_10595 [Oligoflexia bacterium]|nr:hypothetical protein [Oligoflexia bacterium]